MLCFLFVFVDVVRRRVVIIVGIVRNRCRRAEDLQADTSRRLTEALRTPGYVETVRAHACFDPRVDKAKQWQRLIDFMKRDLIL